MLRSPGYAYAIPKGDDLVLAGDYPFQSRVRHFSCRVLQSYNSPGDRARELFIPSTDSASLVVKIEKQNFRFGFELFWGNVTSRGVFALF